MSEVYRACHIVVLPSLAEGLPTALVEASACGRPILASDTPGCNEVVISGVNGLLVPPEDPITLASALTTLLNDKNLRKQMGEAGRRIVLEKFTDDIINAKTYSVYESNFTFSK
jgi:glycosyltransferase involved in cell wall biosynthesis